jgi:hypothetical protein
METIRYQGSAALACLGRRRLPEEADHKRAGRYRGCGQKYKLDNEAAPQRPKHEALALYMPGGGSKRLGNYGVWMRARQC